MRQWPGPLARFWGAVRKGGEHECWPWVGGRTKDGYGHFCPNGPKEYVHRFSYELHVGPIPSGKQIDHLCRNRRCVNPAHLEAVTKRVNWERGEASSARNRRKTHCIYGHAFTPDNTYRDAQGNRSCRICGRRANRESRARIAARLATLLEARKAARCAP